ncbi:MAG: hypothetical protein AVDCRST_MAG51-1047, partial [uncultured Ramlibacter sp.]
EPVRPGVASRPVRGAGHPRPARDAAGHPQLRPAPERQSGRQPGVLVVAGDVSAAGAGVRFRRLRRASRPGRRPGRPGHGLCTAGGARRDAAGDRAGAGPAQPGPADDRPAGDAVDGLVGHPGDPLGAEPGLWHRARALVLEGPHQGHAVHGHCRCRRAGCLQLGGRHALPVAAASSRRGHGTGGALASQQRALRLGVPGADGAVRIPVWLAARHRPAALHRVAGRDGRRRVLGGGRRHPVVHPANGRQAGAALWQLHGRGRHAGVPVHQRHDADLRGRDQWGATGRAGAGSL